MVIPFGKYSLIKKIATGGMAEIYLSQFTSIEGFKKNLVIKKIVPEFSSNHKFISMFIEEAKIAVNFNHRNIVQVFDFGKIDGEYYIAMEYVDGFDLSKLFNYYKRKPKSINLKPVIYILLEVLKGLNYAHNKSENEYFQLVHRDISLNNVIVSRHGDVKLLDFGIAKTGDIISGEDLKGKLSYMAPEQIKRDSLDARVDIYGTGILAWRLLTGYKPFDTQKYNTINSILSVEIPDLREFNPKVPPQIAKMIMQSIEKDRDKRFESAKHFYEALFEEAAKNNLLYNAFQFSAYIKRHKDMLFSKNIIPVIKEEKTKPQKFVNTISSATITNTQTQEKTTKSELNYLTGEKKIVNLVYCDFKSLYKVFEIIPCEQFDKFMNDFFKVVENIVYKYQCSIIFLDNYGMAFVFGAPASREDDSIKAVQFSFDIKDSFDAYLKDFNLDLQISITIHRGGIVVNHIFQDMKIKMVSVDSILKKARSIAEKKDRGVFVTQKLYQSVSQVYNLMKDDDIYKVGAKKDKEESNINKLFGVETEFTGRIKEISQGLKVLDETFKDGKFNLLNIWGEAGVGKSRFIFEFVKNIKQRYKDLYFIKGRSVSYEGGSPYNIVVDALKNFLNINSTQSKKQFEQAIGPYLKTIEEQNRKKEFITLLGHFIGYDYSHDPYIAHLKSDANILKSIQLNYVKSFFKILAKVKPVVIILEDIHWGSSLAINFIKQLIETLEQSKAMLIVAARDQFLKKYPDWIKDFSVYESIYLERLNREESELLLKSILYKIKNIPNSLIEEIYEKSSGIPLFIEEIIKVLSDQKVIYSDGKELVFNSKMYEELVIPLSIESILQARLDALTIDEKKFIQKASVVGRIFWIGIVQQLSDKDKDEPLNVSHILLNLEEKDLIFKKRYKDPLLQDEYIFKHALLKDVAYHSIVDKEKQNYHYQIAHFFRKHPQNQMQNIQGLIGYHYEKAKTYNEAIKFYIQAGDTALKMAWGQETLTYYNKALSLFSYLKTPNKVEHIDLIINISKAYREMGQYKNCLTFLQKAKQFILPLKDNQLLFNLYSEYSEFYHIVGNASKSLLHIAIAKSFVSDKKAYYNLLLKEAWIYYRKNNFKKGLQNLNLVLKGAKDNKKFSEEITEAYRILAIIYSEQGKFLKSIEYSQKTINHYLEKNNISKTAVALNNLGEIYKDMGNTDMARQYYKKALELSKKSANPYLRAILSNNIASLELQEKNYNQAVKLLNYTIEILDDLNTDAFRYEPHRLLAEAYYFLGNYKNSLEQCKLAEKYSLKARNYQNLALIYILLGDYNLAHNNQKETEFYYLKAVELAESIGAYVAQQNVYKKLSKFYENKDKDKVLFYSDKFKQLTLKQQ